tara:strand:- start:19474 stop:19656 length:183 start_codon:yes stop_codon:yes gene_type:complete
VTSKEEWTITISKEERQLIVNSGAWALMYKPEVCGGKELAKVQALHRSLREKLGVTEGFV